MATWDGAELGAFTDPDEVTIATRANIMAADPTLDDRLDAAYRADPAA